MPNAPTLDDLRRYAVARTLFKPTTLARAIDRLGFVQADPIRAPARAQDLILRHRVAGYRAGDLERRYARLKIEEDAFVNYGFLPRRHLALMHPRSVAQAWTAATTRKAADVLAFVRERGPTHPRDVEAHFAHGRRVNAWGGSGLATTHLLDGMHYRGLLRIQRRDNGTRIYAAIEHPPADADAAARTARATALLDLVVRKYAPLPASSLVYLARLLRYGAPHLQAETRSALAALRERLASVQHRRDDVVLARRREPALGASCARRPRPPARAVRPDRLGPAPLRAALGLDVPLRGVHAGAPARARLLRIAAALGRPGRRLGQRRRARAPPGRRDRLRARPGDERRVPPRARRRTRADGDVSRPLTSSPDWPSRLGDERDRVAGDAARHKACVAGGAVPRPRGPVLQHVSTPLHMIATILRRSLRHGAVAVFLALAAPAFAQTALDDVMAKKLITIAIPTDFPPYGFVGTDLKPQGLDIDMANLIGAKLGVKVELVPVTSANRIPYLQTKKADLVISTLGKNPEREKVIDFTAAYSPFFQAVFGPRALAVKSAGRPGRQDASA